MIQLKRGQESGAGIYDARSWGSGGGEVGIRVFGLEKDPYS